MYGVMPSIFIVILSLMVSFHNFECIQGVMLPIYNKISGLLVLLLKTAATNTMGMLALLLNIVDNSIMLQTSRKVSMQMLLYCIYKYTSGSTILIMSPSVWDIVLFVVCGSESEYVLPQVNLMCQEHLPQINLRCQEQEAVYLSFLLEYFESQVFFL